TQGEVTTHIDTVLFMITFRFVDLIDPETGGPVEVDVSSKLPLILNSPNFADADYATGRTQFADAVQRAEFWSVAGPGWPTLLQPPRVLSLNIDVSSANGGISPLPSGIGLPFVDIDYLDGQLVAAMQAAGVHEDELPIFVSPGICAFLPG